MSDTLYLIDTHAFIYRAFYALEGLRSPDGAPTNAIYQFVRMLNTLRRDFRPQYLIAVFDSPGKNLRHEIYPAYKATRRPTPPELIAQIEPIREIIGHYRLATCSVTGYEADDVIGTLAKQAEARGLDVVIVSGDKDLAQLLTPRVKIFDPQKNSTLTADDYATKNGFLPSRLPDLFGLWGDSSDNIPGVAGIGEKIGRELIVKYGSLENLLDHAGEIKGKRGETLLASKADALMSKDLATIRTDAPITFDPAGAATQPPDVSALRDVFTQLGFSSFLKDLNSLAATCGAGESSPRETADAAPAAPRFAALTSAPCPALHIIDGAEKFAAFLSELSAQKEIALTALLDGDDPLVANLVGLGFCWQDGAAHYLPFQAAAASDEPTLGADELAALKTPLENPALAKICAGYQRLILALRRVKIEIAGAAFDVELAAHLHAAHLADADLSALAARYLGVQKSAAPETTPASRETASQFVGEEAVLIRQLAATLREALLNDAKIAAETAAADSLALAPEKYLTAIEMPLARILAAMNERGIKTCRETLARLSDEFGAVLDALRAEIFMLAGAEFNLDSPKQLQTILFEKMKMPALHKTKSGHSTDEAALRELEAQGYPLPRLIIEHRQYAKLKNTYADALPEFISPADGRVHTTFFQTATATGRLASRNPNLQNIPTRTDKGRALRAAFITDADWRLLAADYSQVELRVLAHFSGDAALRQAFKENRDVHRAVAATVYQIPENQVTPEQRRAAKAVNFGLIYGQTAHGLATGLGINHYAAQNFITDYFANFPAVKSYLDDAVARASRNGYVTTLLGRRREIPGLKSSNRFDRERGEREAVNTIIQGTAAEIIKLAMMDLDRRLREEKFAARMLLQIHDELILEAPAAEIPTLTALVKTAMENALKLAVPLTVDIGVGENWLAAKQ